LRESDLPEQPIDLAGLVVDIDDIVQRTACSFQKRAQNFLGTREGSFQRSRIGWRSKGI
jgi:hypothetical protein